MALENFKKIGRTINTRVDYGGNVDAVKTYSEGSFVKLYCWNRFADVKENPTSEIERAFLKRGPSVNFGEEEIIYSGEIKVDGEWKKCLLSEEEVRLFAGCSYLEFRILKEHRERWSVEINKEGEEIGEKPKYDTKYDKIVGLEWTYYDCAENPCYDDFVIFTENYSKEEIKTEIKEIIDGELSLYGGNGIKIGRPPKKKKQKTTSNKVD